MGPKSGGQHAALPLRCHECMSHVISFIPEHNLTYVCLLQRRDDSPSTWRRSPCRKPCVPSMDQRRRIRHHRRFRATFTRNGREHERRAFVRALTLRRVVCRACVQVCYIGRWRDTPLPPGFVQVLDIVCFDTYVHCAIISTCAVGCIIYVLVKKMYP